MDIPGSSLGVPSDTGPHAVQRIPWTSRDPSLVSPQTQAPVLSGGSLGVPSDTGLQTVWRIPWASRDPHLVSPQTQTSKLSGGSLGHPGILPWCPLRHRPPNCLEDLLGIPGSSLSVPSDRGPHPVWRSPWTSRDPPLMSPQTQAPKLSGGSLGHSGILVVPSDTGPHAVRRIPWTSRDPPLVSPQTQAPMLSGRSLGVLSDTGLQTVWRIPWASRDPPLVSPQTEGPNPVRRIP